MPRYLIIGNGVAGTYAAKAIRDAKDSSEIAIFSKEASPFYSRPRLPALLSGEIDMNAIIVYPEKWYNDRGIKLFLNETAEKIDTSKKEVVFRGGKKIGYEKLLIANGSQPAFPQIAGLDNDWVLSLRTLEDAMKIRDYAVSKESVIVIGGGLLGLEAANGLKKLGLQVKVVEFFDRLLPRQTDKEGSEILQKIFEGMGFSFVLGAVTEKIFEEGGKKMIRLKDGRTFSSDFVLISAGIKPDIDLAKTAGIKVNKGIVVDDLLKTSAENVFSAGDAAEHNGRIYGIWPAAEEQGRLAGTNMTGGEEKYNGTVLSTTLKVVGIDLASLGDITGEGALVPPEYKRIDPSKGIYQKIFVKDNKIAGAILLGDIKKAYKIQGMIKNGVDIKGSEEEVLGN